MNIILLKDTQRRSIIPDMYNPDKFVEPFLGSFSRMHRPEFGRKTTPLPRMDDIRTLEETLMKLFFPGHQGSENPKGLRKVIQYLMEDTMHLIYDSIFLALQYENPDKEEGEIEKQAVSLADKVGEALPEIRAMLKTDAQAGYEGDPASLSTHEVILCYPYMKAMAVHRIAHLMYKLGVPLVPRMMSEAVHSETGIDIHPGASIGESFFIDHGTGVSIGETTVIGSHVKLYHGVTLGALSVDNHGKNIQGRKRHPTIEDGVKIYANATILGDITIGKGSTIYSGTMITENIPPYSVVRNANTEITVEPKNQQ